MASLAPRFSKKSSTHMPVLMACVQATDGAVLELGSGMYSTPLLHWLCSLKQRKLITYEDSLDWFTEAKKFQNKYHRIRLVEDWDKIDISGHWSVAFIDQSTASRSPMAIKLKDNADYIVIHDTNSPHHYHYDTVWPHFKYRYDFTKQDPWTSVVSNTKDLSWLDIKL